MGYKMSIEYHTGYCESCDSDRKLERKTPNHILHFLITVVLGIFTYGIGSAIWICIWFLISTKFTGWTCHVCGSKNNEPVSQHTEQNSKNAEKRIDTSRTINIELIINKLKESPKLIMGFIVALSLIIFLFSLDMGDDNTNKKDKKKKENVVKTRVDVNDQGNTKIKDTAKDNKVDSKHCYLYDIKRNSNSISGFVSCKEGKLIVNLYDSESKSIIGKKIVTFKDNKFFIKLDNIEKKNLKFEIKFLGEQITERLNQIQVEKEKSISSITSYDNEVSSRDKDDDDTSKCSIQDWKYSKYSPEYLVVDGKTTCTNGKIVLEVYDESNNRIGGESDYIESGVFSIFFKTNLNPTSISLEYTISQK